MTPPRFVITGTGRCGTRSTSHLLRAVGVNCGHEAWFNPQGGRTNGLDGDVSWIAVPSLSEYEGPVALQVRDPLAVINSLVGIRMFTDPWHGMYRDFMLTHQPGLVGEDIHDAMLWYLAWTRRAQAHAGMTFRIEDVDAAALMELCAFLGFPVSPETCEEALGRHPRDLTHPTTNHRERADLSWADLPEGPLKKHLLNLTEELGYE